MMYDDVFAPLIKLRHYDVNDGRGIQFAFQMQKIFDQKQLRNDKIL